MPPFSQTVTDDNGKGRKLISMSELDVARDLMEIVFVSRDDSEKKKNDFYLSLEEWTPDDLKIKLNFTDPLQMSKGLSMDQVTFKLKNPSIFVSA